MQKFVKLAVLALAVALAFAACANETTDSGSSGPGAPVVIRLYLDRPDTMNLDVGDFIQLRAGEELYIGDQTQMAQGKDVNYPYADERRTTWHTYNQSQWNSFFTPGSGDYPDNTGGPGDPVVYNLGSPIAALSTADLKYAVAGDLIGWDNAGGAAATTQGTIPALTGMPAVGVFAPGVFVPIHDYDNNFVFDESKVPGNGTDNVGIVTLKNSMTPITDIADRLKPIAIRPNRYATGTDQVSYIQMKNAKKKYLFSGEIKLTNSNPGSGGGTPIVVAKGTQPGYYIDFELINKTVGSADYDTVFSSSGSFYLELQVGAPAIQAIAGPPAIAIGEAAWGTNDTTPPAAADVPSKTINGVAFQVTNGGMEPRIYYHTKGYKGFNRFVQMATNYSTVYPYGFVREPMASGERNTLTGGTADRTKIVLDGSGLPTLDPGPNDYYSAGGNVAGYEPVWRGNNENIKKVSLKPGINEIKLSDFSYQRNHVVEALRW